MGQSAPSLPLGPQDMRSGGGGVSGWLSDPSSVVPRGTSTAQGLLVCVLVRGHAVVVVLVVQVTLAPRGQLEVV